MLSPNFTAGSFLLPPLPTALDTLLTPELSHYSSSNLQPMVQQSADSATRLSTQPSLAETLNHAPSAQLLLPGVHFPALESTLFRSCLVV